MRDTKDAVATPTVQEDGGWLWICLPLFFPNAKSRPNHQEGAMFGSSIAMQVHQSVITLGQKGLNKS